MKSLWPVLLVASLSGCSPEGSEDYVRALSETIRASDHIVVTEHSFELDAYDEESGQSLLPEQVIYRTVDLTDQQRQIFLRTIENLDRKAQDAFAACIFEPHHTVRFYSGGKLMSTMQICFRCGEVQWPGTQAIPPWSLYRGLQEVVERVGLKPEQDWSALAQAHLQHKSGSHDEAPL